MRSLYAYEAQRPVDLCKWYLYWFSFQDLITPLAFGENVIITAHPSKTDGDWWYGTSLNNNNTGFFPCTYVVKLENSTYTLASG